MSVFSSIFSLYPGPNLLQNTITSSSLPLRLTQKKMAELFGKGRSTITENLKNIFNEGELNEKSVCRDFRHTAKDCKRYETKHYNLKAETEYEVYRVQQDADYISDFDRYLKSK